jgi:ureidoacrylate peracid hydrolase
MKAAETAVVLIEFQNDFCKEGGKLHELVKGEIARKNTVKNAVELTRIAREKGCLIVHCPFVYDPQWASECAVCGIIAGAGDAGAFLPGREGSEFIEELQPAAGEPILEGKHALSAFTNTALRSILEKNGIRNVILAGFLSNVCVEATAFSAYDLGYQVRIASEATASGSKRIQDYVEEEIYPLVGGCVMLGELQEID